MHGNFFKYFIIDNGFFNVIHKSSSFTICKQHFQALLLCITSRLLLCLNSAAAIVALLQGKNLYTMQYTGSQSLWDECSLGAIFYVESVNVGEHDCGNVHIAPSTEPFCVFVGKPGGRGSVANCRSAYLDMCEYSSQSLAPEDVKA